MDLGLWGMGLGLRGGHPAWFFQLLSSMCKGHSRPLLSLPKGEPEQRLTRVTASTEKALLASGREGVL